MTATGDEIDCEHEKNVKTQFCKCNTCEEGTLQNGTYHVGSYGDYCHIIEGRGWVDAKEVCVNITAHLPRIKSIREHKEVGSLTGV